MHFVEKCFLFHLMYFETHNSSSQVEQRGKYKAILGPEAMAVYAPYL
jgi:hypothetical protein